MTKRKKFSIYVMVIGTILVLYALSMIFPLLWGLMTSFKERSSWGIPGTVLSFPDLSYWQMNKEYNLIDPTAYPNYDNVFGNYLRLAADLRIKDLKVIYRYGWNFDKTARYTVDQGFFDMILNTILYAVGCSFFGALAPCIAGYLCAKYRYKFSGFIYGFVLFVMVMPLVGTDAAMLTLVKKLSMHDTVWGLWIRSFSFANMYFLVFYAFFASMSDAYAEAAQIDGASQQRIMWTIYMPLAFKTISTIFLLKFVALYNDYGVSLVYLPSRPTLSYAIWYFGTGQSASTLDSVPFNLAACYVLAMPMLLFFVIFKNKLMGNISVGGVKE